MEGIIVEVDSQDCINYAMYQNGVPVIRSVSVTNNSGIILDNAEIRISSEPVFLRASVAKISDLGVGRTVVLSAKESAIPLSVVDDDMLVNASERVNGRIIVELYSNNASLASMIKEVRVLPYDEWPGMNEAASISAFVTPNSKSLAMIRSKASDSLRYMQEVPSLEGYQSHDRQRVQKMVAAIFAAYKTVNINYVTPPADFEKMGQRVRLVDSVISDKEGTCLDLSVAFASAAESMGLHPLIVFTTGHAFVGVWLDDDCFPDMAVYDMAAITREVRNGSMCVVECTALATDSPSDFEEAKRLALSALQDDSNFECAIDVTRSRTVVRPLPLRFTMLGKYVIDREEVEYVPEVPKKVSDDVALADGRTLTKLEFWERKLLDVSLKNNLIRLKKGKRLMPLMIGDSCQLENKLATGTKFSILPKPQEWDGGETYSKVPYESSSYISNYKDGFSLELDKGVIRSPLTESETRTLLKGLYRDAKRELEENGSNSLFLSLGVLKWFDQSTGDEPLYAPLILVPVSITRSVSCYTMKMIDEETIMNVTLLEKLNGDGIMIPGLDPLPEDDNGVDVEQVFQIVRKCIAGKPGWDVIDSAFIGIFSFNQFVMWKDLTQFSDRLVGNKIVNSLMEQKLTWQPEKMPEDSDPYGLCLTVPADSSQIRAVRASGEGISFVLHGPPGTGKSQTITNMISNALFSGKTVLFVAEKRAALEVVEKRLTGIGIANHCLELHSNRADKASVLDQLRSAYTTASEISREELDEKLKLVCKKRDALDQYVVNLHRIQPFGLSIYEAISEFEKISAKDNYYQEIMVPYQIIEAGKREIVDVCDAIDRMIAMYALIDRTCEYRRFVIIRESKISLVSDFEKAMMNITKNYDAVSALIKELGDLGVKIDFDKVNFEEFMEYLKFIDMSSMPAIDKIQTFTGYGKYADVLEKLVIDCVNHDIEDAFQLYEEAKAAFESLRKDGCFNLLDGFETLIARLADLGGKIAEAEDAKNAMTKVWTVDTATFNSKYRISEKWNEASNAGLFSKKKMRKEFMDAVMPHLIHPLDFDEIKANIHLVNTYADKKLELDAVSSKLLDETFLSVVNGDVEKLKQMIASSVSATGFSNKYAIDIALIPILFQNADKIAQYVSEYNKKRKEMKTALSEASALIGCDLNAYQLRESILIIKGLWAHIYEIQDWIEWNRCMHSMKEWGLEQLVDFLDKGKDPSKLKQSFLKALYLRVIRDGIGQSPNLRVFNSKLFEATIGEFKRMDREYTECSKQMLKYMLSKRVPTNIDSYGDSENHILSRALQGQRMKMSIRSLFTKIPNLLTRICPCMLMSPLSVSQYLPPELQNFDLVIFDEASQIPTYKAVASLARANNAVIVGDPKQLPPTVFFDRKRNDDDEDDETEDLESFLDDCLSLNMPESYLEWHYRSKHESLILFSNRTYYNGKMLTFPSHNDIETRISLRLVDGTYERGKRVNVAEAEAIADEVIARKTDPERCEESIGVITFNISQQDLIEDLVIDRIGKDGKLYEKVLGGSEPTFFKNIESVQGDERDVVLFSICFGPSGKDKTVYQNFGPLNRAGGGRRLNVAVTRARKEMVVFSSMTAEGIRPSTTSSDGVVNLKEFIRYAQNEGRFTANDKIKRNDSNSILTDVSNEIRKMGYETNFNVGNSEFRVDIGVVDPNNPNSYIMGLISDGGSYKTADNTRDREYGRFDVLRMLGWNLFFVWSVEWLYKRDEIIREIKRRLDNPVEQMQEPERDEPDETEVADEDEGFNPYYSIGVKAVKRVCIWKKEVTSFEPDLKIPDYQGSLRAEDVTPIAQYVLDRITPISDNYLAYCISKIYDLSRITGANMDMIREVMETTRVAVIMKYENGERKYTTYYKRGTPVSAYGTYFALKEGDQRPIQMLAIEEVISAVLFVAATVPSSDKESLYMSAVRELGYSRGGQKIKEVVLDAIDIATQKNYLNIVDDRYVINPDFKVGDITIDVETDEISEGLMKRKRSIDDFSDAKIKEVFIKAFASGVALTKDELFDAALKDLGFKKISDKMRDRFDGIFAQMFNGTSGSQEGKSYEGTDDEPEDDADEPPTEEVVGIGDLPVTPVGNNTPSQDVPGDGQPQEKAQDNNGQSPQQ